MQDYPLKNDPLYWKNRKPYTGYYQQDVHYKIHAVINEENHTIVAKQKLQYWNNSNDTLHFVFFHLYQNAFVKNAYTESFMQANKVQPRFGPYESKGLGTIVDSVSVNGTLVQTELDNTIMKVYLEKPLLPQSSIQIEMNFISFFDSGSTRRRMKMYPAWGFMHYNGCQWFPKMSVYDSKFGWDTYQHIGKEFYGDFGIYDITLDFPSNYIVEATGALQNRATVLPDDLRAKLDITNFKDKPWNEAPSVIIPYQKGERKQWHFRAEHVHDFAFTADPSYRIGTSYWNNVECVGIVQEPHASGWQNAADYVAKIIQVFSENYGQYHYPKMVAADAADGMEYPMLTLDGGRDPGYRGLLVHEIGHNWFYGMVGNNETYRAALDEGFTQYLTAEGLRLIDGDTMVETAPKNWKKKYHEPRLAKDTRVMYPYIYNTSIGLDYPLNTHSDDFNGAIHHGGGYAGVYYKSATMLYQLQYVLGDSLFRKAMLHYFDQWKFAHPYFEDFRNSIIQYTKNDLNWFFDQWLETTKSVDYKISKIKNYPSKQESHITFKRSYPGMQMPIDFTTIDKNGKSASFYIPNTWYEKSTKATTLPRWIGWGKVKRTYTAIIPTESEIKKVTIDTALLLADRYMLNNSKKKGVLIDRNKIITKLDIGNAPYNDWKHYRLYWRPNVWYNALDGVKVGLHFEGSYLQHILKLQGDLWFNSTLGRWYQYMPAYNEHIYDYYTPLNYQIQLSTPFALSKPQIQAKLESKFLDGLWMHSLGAQWKSSETDIWSIAFQSMYRNKNGTDYLLIPNEWSSNTKALNNSFNALWSKNYKGFKSAGNLQVSIRTPLLTNAFDYSYIQLENIWIRPIEKFLLKTRVFARIGNGSNMPNESALFLSGANLETMMQNKYTRSVGIIPTAWYGISTHQMSVYQHAGGMNLRGYNGYYAYDERYGKQYLAYKSRSGIALNTELEFSNYIRLKPKWTRNWLTCKAYLFFDAGINELSDYSDSTYWETSATPYWSDVRMDAGIGSVFTIKNWFNFAKAKPLSIRVEMPFWINRPNYGATSYFYPRFLLGLNVLL